MTTDTDPALRRLLDELPNSNPDRDEIEVWVDHCPLRHFIPNDGQAVTLDFGLWRGPPTRWEHMRLCARLGVMEVRAPFESMNVEVLTCDVRVIGTVNIKFG